MPVFDRGDIVSVNLNPTLKKEAQGNNRPYLVLSSRKYNQIGLTYVAPITQSKNQPRLSGFSIPLMGSGTITQGIALITNVRALDLNIRQAEKIEQAPKGIIREALEILNVIFEE